MFRVVVDLVCRWTVIALLLGGLVPQAVAQPREKVVFAISYTPITAIASYLYPAKFLKFWEAEGLDVELVPTQGTGQVLQLLASGGADMGLANPEPYVVARIAQNLPARAVGTMGVISTWSVGVLPESPIQDLAQLKGKNIGVTSLASGGVYFLKARLIEAGLNPDKDVTLVPVGFGASANDAVASGKVAAMLLWRSGFVILENIGTKFRYLPRAAWEDDLYSLLNLASSDMIAKRPEVVAKVLRGIAKCFEFSAARPEATAMVYEEAYPSATSRSVDAKTNFENNVRLIKATMTDGGLLAAKFPKPPNRVWGGQTDAGWQLIEDYLKKVGLIDKEVPPSELYTDRFTAAANQFDHAAIRNEAMDYKVPY
jgi:NitT/TauT family transport system substrate-binding protein